MKPFDLDQAKAGAKLVTRSGKKARIICYDRVDTIKKGSIVALICNDKKTWERPVYYNLDGTQIDFENNLDLLLQDD